MGAAAAQLQTGIPDPSPAGGHRHPPRPRAQPQGPDRLTIPHGQFTVITGVSGSGKSTPRLRYPVRRGPAALSGVPQRLCPPVRPARRPRGCGRHLRHPAHGGHRAAHQPRRGQEHRRHPDGDPPLPAPALCEARHPVLPGLRPAHPPPGARRDPGPDPARLRRAPGRPAGPPGGGPQGDLPGAGPWARGQGFATLRVDGEPVAHRTPGRAGPLPRARHRPAGGGADGWPRRPRPNCAPCSAWPWVTARAWCGWRRSSGGGWGAGRDLFHRAAPAPVRARLPGAGPAALPLQLQARLVPQSASAPAPGCRASTPEQSGEEDRWLEDPAAVGALCPARSCRGARLRREALAVRFRGRSIADLSALTVDQAAEALAGLDLDRAGGGHGPGPAGGGAAAGSASCARWAWAI